MLARVDLERVAEQVDYDVLPAYVQLVSSTPGEVNPDGAPELVPLGRPELSEGPHLGYAVQWFTFTTIAVVGYALLLRRVARDEAREEAGRAADAASTGSWRSCSTRKREPVDPGQAHRRSARSSPKIAAAALRQAAGTVAAVSTASEPRTLVMHGLRLKGFGEAGRRR